MGVQTYIIQGCDGGPIKIGKSSNVQDRLVALQGGRPRTVGVVGTIDGDVEAELHKRFAAYRMCGEWFRVSKEIQDWWRNDVRIKQNPRWSLDTMCAEIEPLALTAEQIVSLRLLPVSVRSWRRADSAGQIPRGIRFGQKKMWRLSDLRTWIEMGCPDRAIFERETAR